MRTCMCAFLFTVACGDKEAGDSSAPDDSSSTDTYAGSTWQGSLSMWTDEWGNQCDQGDPEVQLDVGDDGTFSLVDVLCVDGSSNALAVSLDATVGEGGAVSGGVSVYSSVRDETYTGDVTGAFDGDTVTMDFTYEASVMGTDYIMYGLIEGTRQ